MWLLGQASFAVVNGLGYLGLLDQVWVDGTWYLKDSMCDKLAVLNEGLITMLPIGRGIDSHTGAPFAQAFLTCGEMMAANLRSLLAAYQGLWQWPDIPMLPDVNNPQQQIALQQAIHLN